MIDEHGVQRLTEALRDRYRVEHELGAGGMATVYLAEDLRHPRKVAIKVLRADLSATIGTSRFLQEIEIAARLQHPHILPLLDSGEADGSLYYVMPFVEGSSLRARLDRSGALSPGESVRILTSVVDALAYAHAKGVVHRDIKPDNIMLAGRHAVVADFGVAKAVSEARSSGVQTTIGMALGTPTYMSPEQASADPDVDHRADIYAVGAMAYEMLSGKPPFVSDLLQKVLAAHLTEVPAPLSSRAPGVSLELERVVMRCLEKIPADRYQSADELLADLERHVGAGESAVLTPTQTRSTARSRRVPLVVGGVALMVALLVALAALVTRDWGTSSALAMGTTSQLTADPGLEMEPAVSPDGGHVAYAAGSLGYVRIMVRPVAGGRATSLTSDSSTSEWGPRWSHDGTRLLFLNARGASSAPAFGGPARQEIAATAVGPVLWAAWSRDDRRIAFVRGDSLLIHTLGTGAEQYVTSSGDLHSCDWSIDGALFACVAGNSVSVTPGRRFGNLAPSSIIVIAARGGVRHTLPDSAGWDLSPVWHPDGKHLLFVSSRHGKWDVYRQAIEGNGSVARAADRVTTGLGAQSIALSADGSRLVYSAYEARANAWAIDIPAHQAVSSATARKLTNGTRFIEAVSVSWSGRWLVYDSDLRGTSNLYRMLTSGGEPEELTADSTREFRGDLSRDERELAFMSWRTGSRDVFVMPLDSRRVTQVTHSSNEETYPTWAPDGNALAFFTSDRSEVSVVRRDASGRWGAPVKRADGTLAHWSPDGQLLCYQIESLGAIGIVGAFSGVPRIVYRPAPGSRDPSAESVLFSRDGRTLYFKSHDTRGAASIWSIPVEGGVPRLLVRFDDPAQQSNWPELSSDGRRFYFTIDESQSDVYVASLARR